MPKCALKVVLNTYRPYGFLAHIFRIFAICNVHFYLEKSGETKHMC